MQDEKHASGSSREEPEESTKKSIEDGRKAIEAEKKASGKPDEKTKDEQAKDAEQWRNEG